MLFMTTKSSKRQWLSPKGDIETGQSGRKITMSPVKNTGRFATQKATKSQDFESLLERDFMVLLEYDTRVASFTSQPITLRWIDENGIKRSYTPDVLVRYKSWLEENDSSPCLIFFEVKPRAVLKRKWPKLKPTFKAAIAWTRKMGYQFKIVTEKEIQTPYLNNIKFLLRFRSDMPVDDIANNQKHLVLEMIVKMQKTTPKLLLEAISTIQDRQVEFLPWIWHLVSNNAIGCDLMQPINMNSPIWCIFSSGNYHD